MVLSFHRVSKIYRQASGASLCALRDVNIEVAEGTKVAITGRSGSGKSTFLHLAAGIDTPSQGEITLLGRNLAELSERQRSEFGAALKSIHMVPVPAALTRRIRQEKYAPKWRKIVRTFLGRVEDDAFGAALDDPVAVKLAAYLRAKRAEISDLVERAEHLAQALWARPPEPVLCHSDAHAGNVLIDVRGKVWFSVGSLSSLSVLSIAFLTSSRVTPLRLGPSANPAMIALPFLTFPLTCVS